MGKGEDFNKKIWDLFERAGFETKPNSQNPGEHLVNLPEGKTRPIDLYARVSSLDVTIVGSNKARSELKSFTAHMADLAMLRDAEKADAALFVSGEKDVDVEERRFARRHGIQVWDRREVEYYAAITDAIGTFAKYEIVHALGIETKEEKLKDTILGLRVRQPNVKTSKTELFIFSLPAEKLLQTCVVLRKAQGSAYAYQRILSAKRLPKIGAFVRTPDALLPTDIVVHLDEDVEVDEITIDKFRDKHGQSISLSRGDQQLVALTIPLRYGSLELIDGQHRLYGFAHTTEEARRSFNLVVVAMRDLREIRRCETFVAINDNARRVDPNLVSYLRYTKDERVCKGNADLMAIKIAVRLNEMSPFRGQIRLLDTGRQRLTLKGVSGYDLRGLVGPKGMLRRYYPSNSSEVYLRALRRYFSEIKRVFQKEWNDPDTYIIATNRGITAFLKLLRSMLTTEERKVSPEKIRKYLLALKSGWDTWETAKLKRSYVGSQGWAEFHEAMVSAIRKRYPTFQK